MKILSAWVICALGDKAGIKIFDMSCQEIFWIITGPTAVLWAGVFIVRIYGRFTNE